MSDTRFRTHIIVIVFSLRKEVYLFVDEFLLLSSINSKLCKPKFTFFAEMWDREKGDPPKPGRHMSEQSLFK